MRTSQHPIDRRTALKGIGACGPGLVVGGGSASAKPGRGPPGGNGRVPGFSGDDPSVSNCTVVNNAVGDPDPDDVDAGVAVQAFDLHPERDSVVDNNEVVRNTITGFEDAVIEGKTGTNVHEIEP